MSGKRASAARAQRERSASEGARRGSAAPYGAGKVTHSVGVFDPLSAKLAERAGFDVLFLSGYAVSATLLGLPDVGLLTQSEVLDAARRVVSAVKVPVIVDGDTGHGSVANVQRLVRELLAMGARGVLLEDQVWPKRCGHMAGKQVVPCEEHVAKLRAAAEAREALVKARGSSPFWILGRTDARAPLGLDEALRRARAYKEAGADILFVEAPESTEELRRIGAELPGPLIANMVEGGRTPLLSPVELHELGFEWVVHPITGLLAAAGALDAAYRVLRRDGAAADSPPLMTFEELTDLLGLRAVRALEARLRA